MAALLRRSKPIQILLKAFAIAFVCLQATAQESMPAAIVGTAYQINWDLRIPMRDGGVRSARKYQAIGQTGPLPVILTITPYTAGDNLRGKCFYGAVLPTSDLLARLLCEELMVEAGEAL